MRARVRVRESFHEAKFAPVRVSIVNAEANNGSIMRIVRYIAKEEIRVTNGQPRTKAGVNSDHYNKEAVIT
jgi:hypothetical protein